MIGKYFLPFIDFHFVDSFLHCADIFSPACLFLLLLSLLLVLKSKKKKKIRNTDSQSLAWMLSSRIFMVSLLTLKSLICFELIFVYGVR